MISYIILAVSLAILGAYYAFVFRPSRTIKKFALNAQGLGYRVKLMPYQFMSYFLVKYLRKDNKSLRIFKEELKQYDLIVGNMFTSLAVVIANEELLKDFFNQSSKFPKSPFFTESFQLLNGGGVVFSDGETWKRKRKTISSVFHFDFLNDKIPAIKDEIHAEFDKIDKLIQSGSNVNLLKSFMSILSSVIARSFFGTNMKEYNIEGVSYCEYFVQYLNQIMSFNASLEHFLFGMKVYNLGLSSQSRNLKKKYIILNSIAKEIVEKELQKIKTSNKSQKNMITALYQAGLLNLNLDPNQSKPDQYSLYDLIGQFWAFFAAGTDTTAHSANVALHYLSENPDYVQKIRGEIDAIDEDTSLSQSEKVKKMKWIDAVFNETIRLNGPVGYIFTRTSTEDANIGKLQIPKGSSLTMMPILMHYKDKNFADPMQFKPERWMENNLLQPFTFVPFGGGERNCLGQHLARIQAKLLISEILKKYDIKALNPIMMKISFVYGNEYADFQVKSRNNKT